MKRAGWNPTRRNRNIGTERAGHGLANRLVIPDSWNDPRVYWAKLRNPVVVEAGGLSFFVEAPSAGCAHAVTLDDVLRVLGMLPPEHVRWIRAIVLRQPTRKQRILSCVWGRLAYFSKIGATEGPMIILEAQRIPGESRWSKSLQPDDAEELQRLREDGHEVVSGRRSWTVRSNLESVRATQLFRTLPHEVGHYVQYDAEVRQRAMDAPEEWTQLEDAYFSRPVREREDFAHRYAREFLERQVREGRLPFERCIDEVRMTQQKLDPTWFGA